ncbi:MAG: CinA family protein [Betaproteobacteria bacterium]|nr:CinA family protein [Betaproteobacteria bacterium]
MVDRTLQVLANELALQLVRSQCVLTLSESCTGGLVSALLTEIPGSSTWFDSAYVVYSNQAKKDMLGISAFNLEQFGAVSEEVAAEMAAGALLKGRANLAASITGIAGPTGGTANKPVGTVCFGWAGVGKPLITTTKCFSGTRAEVRQQAVKVCLEGLLHLTISSNL